MSSRLTTTEIGTGGNEYTRLFTEFAERRMRAYPYGDGLPATGYPERYVCFGW